jgi:ParB/RepB/Spo0J family partition protein
LWLPTRHPFEVGGWRASHPLIHHSKKEKIMQKKQPKKSAVPTNGAGDLRWIPLSAIEPTADNVRKNFDQQKFAELVRSVKDKGVLQAILLRPVAVQNGVAKYQIIAGERRFRAATAAGLTEIPAYVKALNDEEALSAGLLENLLREDLHPLDEAAGYLRLRTELKLPVRQIAERVAKAPRYVARRLPLTSLIEEAQVDFRGERLTLAHVLELCRLAPEIQAQALAICYETKSVRNKAGAGYDFVPDKTQPARPVRFLQEWLVKNVHLNLQAAPFKLDDARLREDGLSCLTCPQRSGHDKLLFADIKESDMCLNPRCYQAKLRRWLELIKANVEAKQGKPTVFISAYHGWQEPGTGTLSRDQYQLLQKKAERCAFAEQAVFEDGVDIGKVQWICRAQTCQDHLGKVPDPPPASPTSSANPGAGTVQVAAQHARKQELFNLKVDELVRKRVFTEALKVFSWPLERKHLNEAVKEFFRRLPIDVQKVIGEVCGWNDALTAKARLSEEAVLKELVRLDDHRLAQFLMLCSFAHYGANPEGQRQVNQSLVVALSQACGVNHLLIDAEVRLARCPKKYKETHEAYLAMIKNGQPAEMPVVFERTIQTTTGSAAGPSA